MSDPNWYKKNEKTMAMVNEHGEVMHKLFNDIARAGFKGADAMQSLEQLFSAVEMRKNPDNYRSAFPKFDSKKADRAATFGSVSVVLGSVQ